MTSKNLRILTTLIAMTIGQWAPSSAQVPAGIAADEKGIVAIFHGEGAEIYECQTKGPDLRWESREPIASLISEGNTVGKHSRGPLWELPDGSAVTAKATGSAQLHDATSASWLKYTVTKNSGLGILSDVSVVQRINVSGGMLAGNCSEAGELRSVPFSADFVFLRAD